MHPAETVRFSKSVVFSVSSVQEGTREITWVLIVLFTVMLFAPKLYVRFAVLLRYVFVCIVELTLSASRPAVYVCPVQRGEEQFAYVSSSIAEKRTTGVVHKSPLRMF